MYCAHCHDHVAPDERHVYVSAETRDPQDRNSMDDFAFHPDCWREVSDEWMQPA